jgi:AAA+ superfamily predicted ATPase
MSNDSAPTNVTICPVCQQGVVNQGKILFMPINSFFECEYCHTKYVPAKEKYILKDIPSGLNRWKSLEGQPLNWDEILRIKDGGFTDVELFKQEEEKRRLQEQQEQERRLRETPGTPQWYMAKYKTIIGMPLDETTVKWSFDSDSPLEKKQSIGRIRQMEKELRLLRRQLVQEIKESRSHSPRYSRGTGSRLHPREYSGSSSSGLQVIVDQIDSTLVNLDGVKLRLETGYVPPSPVSSANPNQAKQTKIQKPTPEVTNIPENLLNELDSLAGLETVKEQVLELVNFIKVQRLRQIKGLPVTPISLHTVFYGNPGTGKTSVARLLSNIFKSLGVLSKGHLVETDRSGLVAGYVGQTALKVNEIVNQALGGILFIDEAYALTESDKEDFGREAIDTLIKQMEDHRDDLVVIVAGYTEKMEHFLQSNPGLRSRFNRYWKFEDYTADQLLEIFDSFCKNDGFRLSIDAKKRLAEIFQRAYEQRNQTFGNARLARNLFESTISNQASRIVNMRNPSADILATIEPNDIPDMMTNDILH